MLRKTGPDTVNPDDLLTKYKLDISKVFADYLKKPDEIYKNDNNEECDDILQEHRINIATNGLNKIFAAKNMLEIKTLLASTKKALEEVDASANRRFERRADDARDRSVDIQRGIDPRTALLALSELAYNTTASKVSQSKLTNKIDNTWKEVSKECEKIAPSNNITIPKTKQYAGEAKLDNLANNKFVVAEKLKKYIDKESRFGAGLLNVRRDENIFKQRLKLAQDCLNNVLNASNSSQILDYLKAANTQNQAIKTGGKLQKRFNKLIPELETLLGIQKPVDAAAEVAAVTEGKGMAFELKSLPSQAGHFKKAPTAPEVGTAPAPAMRPRRSSSSGSSS